MLQSEITGDGMDAVASEISPVERSRRCAIHILIQTRFLEVTLINCNYDFLSCGYNHDRANVLIIPITKRTITIMGRTQVT